MENKIIKKIFVIYDSECGFCNKIMLKLKRIDEDNLIHWEPRNSEKSNGLLEKHNIDKDLDSIVVITNKKYLTKSDAIIYTLIKTGIKSAYILKIFPKKFRDFIYECIARNRYLFGSCKIK